MIEEEGQGGNRVRADDEAQAERSKTTLGGVDTAARMVVKTRAACTRTHMGTRQCASCNHV